MNQALAFVLQNFATLKAATECNRLICQDAMQCWVRMRKSKKACHDPVDHSRQLTPLRRIEGPVRGLQQMITDQRYCLDVINQMGAISAALRRVQSDMLREHLAAIGQTSICGKLAETDREELAEEVSALLKRLG